MTSPTLHHDDDRGWWTRWTVPAPIAVIALAILTVFVVLAFHQLAEDRHAAAEAIAKESCEQANEFRGFMSEYLTNQIGEPLDDIEGFAELPVDQQEFLRQLAPVLEASQASDAAYAAEYKATFPIRQCNVPGFPPAG
jgi:hypothetical protein